MKHILARPETPVHRWLPKMLAITPVPAHPAGSMPIRTTTMRIKETLYHLATQRLFDEREAALLSTRRLPTTPRARTSAKESLLTVAALPSSAKRAG